MSNTRPFRAFLLGGSVYVGLELLWRRRSHISMFAAGGASLTALSYLRRTSLPAVVKPLAGALIITGIELGAGLLVNRRYRVWDYRGLPGNYRGQICPQFSLLWVPLSAAGMALSRRLEL